MGEMSLAGALAEFQRSLPAIHKGERAEVPTKSGGKYTYSYADLADVSGVVLPALGAVGLSFNARPTLNEGGKFVLAYELLHTSGESRTGEYPLPQSGTSQEIGSAITYARRYALCSVTGVAPDKDDDGAAANTARTNVVERHWDPAEQEVLVTGWTAEIQDAKDATELQKIGQNIKSALRRGELSRASYDHLSKVGSARRAEFDGGAA